MATYYVRTDGSDSNNGTGYQASQAFQTIGKAISVVSAGDTIYVAPGYYNESLSISTSGTSASPINLVGDPSSDIFLDVQPADVVIWYINATIINFAANVQYWNIRNLVITGHKSGSNGVFANDVTYVSTRVIENCVVQVGGSGVVSCTVKNSFVFGGFRGIKDGAIAISCVLMGQYPIYGATEKICKAYFSILIGHGKGCYYAEAYNCTLVSCHVETANRCVVVLGDYYGMVAANECDYIGCVTVSSGSASADVGYQWAGFYAITLESIWVPIVSYFNLERMKLLFSAFIPSFISSKASLNSYIPPTGAKSAFFQTPSLYVGGHSFQQAVRTSSNVPPKVCSLNYSFYKTNPPSLVFTNTDEGSVYIQYPIAIPVKKGEQIAKKVWCYHTGYYYDRPSILLTGSVTSESSASATTTNTWEQLSVSATASEDGYAFLLLRMRHSATSHATYWSDFE